MSCPNKKIKAFTLSEMLVVLVISSIVVSLSLVVLNLVQQQLSTIKKNNTRNTEIRILERALIQDFNRYNLRYDKNSGQLICTSVKDTVVYTLRQTYVMRNQDTLDVSVFNTTSYLEGNIVQDSPIDAIAISLSEKIPEKKLFISKTKDATFYMNGI